MSFLNFLKNFFKISEDIDLKKINQLNNQFIDDMKTNPLLSDMEKEAIINANEELTANEDKDKIIEEK